MAGIYKIINTADGKFYVGSTNDFIVRKRHHLKALRHGYHHNVFLQRAWDKYGEGSFKFEIVVYCEEKDLIFFEQRFIDYYKLPNEDVAYNLSPDAVTFRGYKQSEEHKAKRSKQRIGIALTEDHKNSISKSKKGRKNFRKRVGVDTDKVIRMYVSGISAVEIARTVGVKVGVVYRRLSESNIIRRQYTGEKDIDVGKIKLMLDGGLTIYAIAKTLHVSRTAIETKIKKMEINPE